MNRLRREKLLRRFVFLLLFVVLCRSFWPLYVTPWGAQRAFQRQYHWGPGRVLCQEEGQREYRLLAWWYCSAGGLSGWPRAMCRPF